MDGKTLQPLNTSTTPQRKSGNLFLQQWQVLFGSEENCYTFKVLPEGAD